MSKEQLLKINEEYKTLKNLEFSFYFKLNKVKSISFFFICLLLIPFIVIFYSFIKGIYLPVWADNIQPLLLYSFFYISYILITSLLVSIVYIQGYCFISYIKNNKNSALNSFNTYKEYKDEIKKKQAIANELLSTIKNQHSQKNT